MADRRIVYPDADETMLRFFAGERRRRVERLGSFEILTGIPASAEAFAERLAGAHAVILHGTVAIADEALETAPELEVISVCGVGAGSFVDFPAAAARGVTVCNSPDATVNTVAVICARACGPNRARASSSRARSSVLSAWVRSARGSAKWPRRSAWRCLPGPVRRAPSGPRASASASNRSTRSWRRATCCRSSCAQPGHTGLPRPR